MLVLEGGLYMHKMYKSYIPSALFSNRMNVLILFDNTTNSASNASVPKGLTAANMQNKNKLLRAATPFSAT